MLAAAKAGLKIVDVDTNLVAVPEVREFLRLAQCKALYFQPQIGEVDYLKLLRKSIPEFYHYDDSAGQLFHSKYYPTLRFFIHNAVDNEIGALNLQELFLRDPPVSYVKKTAAATTDDTPLYCRITKENGQVKVTDVATHGKVLSLPAWSYAKKLVSSEYFEAN